MSITTTYEVRPRGAAVAAATLREPPRPTALQSLIDELTAQTWLGVGLRLGMRVLVAGRGLGELSLRAAAMVGTRGSVIGVDASTEVIRSAALRAAEAGWSNLRFTRQELARVEVGAPVDAVLVRSALFDHADPWGALRGLARSVTPGGLIVVQEIDEDESLAPIAETTFDRLDHAPHGSALEQRIALRLCRIFRAAGLSQPRLTLGAGVPFVSASARR